MLPLRVLPLTLRVILGIIFLYSGGEKIIASGLDEFTRAILRYQILNLSQATLLAYTLPWLEILTGLCLMLGIATRAALSSIILMVTMFTVAVAHAQSIGLNIACGCRGTSEPINYNGKWLEFTAYFTTCLFLYSREISNNRTANSSAVST